jgi:hypothetical protein
VNAIRVARSVVALLDTAARLEEVPDSHPDVERLARAGCFRGGMFDPGEAGLAVVRGGELADQPSVPGQDLVAALAVTASGTAGRRFPVNAPVPTVPPEAVHHEMAPRGAVLLPSAPLEAALHHGPPSHRVSLRGAPRR